jgi:hypothetical protein
MSEYEQLWNDTDKEGPEDLERNLPLRHIVHHKSHAECQGMSLGLHGGNPSSDCLSCGVAQPDIALKLNYSARSVCVLNMNTVEGR